MKQLDKWVSIYVFSIHSLVNDCVFSSGKYYLENEPAESNGGESADETMSSLEINKCQETKKNFRSFSDVLALLTSTDYNLYDAYPTLTSVYSIVLAIPVSSASAEQSFSVLKRIKSRIRSVMGQGRLDALLAMSIERTIVESVDPETITDLFANSSTELKKALIF